MSLKRIALLSSVVGLVACSSAQGVDEPSSSESTVGTSSQALSGGASNNCTFLSDDRTSRTEGSRQVVDVKLTLNQATPRDIELCVGDFEKRGLNIPVKDAPLGIEGATPANHESLDHVQILNVPGAPNSGILTIPYKPKLGFAGVDTMKIVTGKYDFKLEITVKPFLMRAIGDSITAGFGYLDDGSSMTPDAWGLPGDQRLDPVVLMGCKPLSDFFSDRCSSNSTSRFLYGDRAVKYSSDYGYANNVSWAAQLAHIVGVPATQKAGGIDYRTYANYAITGSEPGDWAGITSHSGAAQSNAEIEMAQSGVDLTVMTVGANPLLSQLLMDHAGECEEAARNYKLHECVAKYVKNVDLRSRVRQAILRNIWGNQTNHILVMLYPTVWPAISIYSPQMIDDMVRQINAEIDAAARSVQAEPRYAGRVAIAKPPSFDFGAPMNPFLDACDGPSKQSRISQDLFSTLKVMKCTSGEYWVISADTGIQPSQAGYAAIAGAAYQEPAEVDLLLPWKATGYGPK